MRADRLISLLMLLQARGRMSARRLAAELEVCERTIYRDIEALSAAGVPIYSEPGRNGGYALLDNYRTDLTGLTQGEVQALFMLNTPAPLVDLGIGLELQAALRKLSAALTKPQRQDEERVRQRFFLDSVWWHQGGEPVPHLQTVYQAIWDDHQLVVIYRLPSGVRIDQIVDPYGLVAKAGVWYGVFLRDRKPSVQRIADLLDVQWTDVAFVRDPTFDLEAFWRAWCTERERGYLLYCVTARVAPHFLPWLSHYFGTCVRAGLAQAAVDAKGWTIVELAFESLEAARDRLLDCGGGIEVLEPLPLRESIRDYADRIRDLYCKG